MTNQEVFDKVANHLLTQGKKSLGPVSGLKEGCVYRSPEGLKCAVGCLIPDENYSPSLEGKRANNEEVMKAAGLTKEQGELVDRLQLVHDGHAVSDWLEQLNIVAQWFALTPYQQV